MLTRMAPYKPRLYSFMSRSRFRQYPARTVTSIPGAGFRGRKLLWARQPLLLGLGQDMIESRGGRVFVNPNPEPPVKWKRVGWRGPYSPVALRRVRAIGGLGAGDVVGRVIPTLASILADPELALSREGPGLVTAIDRHLMGPLVRSGMRHAAPYVIPPLLALLIFSGLGAYMGIRVAKKLGA